MIEQETSTEPLTVSFCCNDERGNFTGVMEALSVGEEWAELMGPLDLSNEDPITGIAFLRSHSNRCVQIGTEGKPETWKRFPLQTYGEYVGSITYNAGEMEREHIAALLNHLRSLGGWSLEVAETNLFHKWEAGETITPQDLGCPEPPELPCPYTVPLPLEEPCTAD